LTTSIVECPHCHYRFNYEFIPSASFYSIRLGKQRIFKCPHCHELHNFKVTNFGKDPSLPTHGDNAETGIGAKTWALLLGPLLTFVVIGYILLFTFQHIILLIIPLTLGITWTAVYVVHLYQKVRRGTDGKTNEAM
jgi:hypothetical protein